MVFAPRFVSSSGAVTKPAALKPYTFYVHDGNLFLRSDNEQTPCRIIGLTQKPEIVRKSEGVVLRYEQYAGKTVELPLKYDHTTANNKLAAALGDIRAAAESAEIGAEPPRIGKSVSTYGWAYK